MKRPLAFFGTAFFVTMLAAVWLPAGFVYAAALVFAAAFVALLLRGRRVKTKAATRAALALAALALALLVFHGYDALVVQPLRQLAGQEREVTARVTAAEPDTGGDTMQVTLEVLTLGDEALSFPFSVSLAGFREVQVGDVLSLRLSFYEIAGRYAASRYAKGFYIGARAVSAPQVVGQSLNFVCRMRLWQYAASENIRARLPQRLASVLSAMALGDKRFLTQQTRDAYRAAGLSHVLVVSGMHLSILCGLLYGLVHRFWHRKRIAALICILFVLLFMAFTGFSPSIIRSGVAFLLVYFGGLFYRKADIFTSLAVAALLLCLQNPYAAADAGLLLSFAATLGAVGGGALAGRLQAAAGKQKAHLPRAGQKAAALAAVPLCVTLTTLPVLLAYQMGVSAFTIPMNILVVPLLGVIVVLGLVCALPAVPVLGWLASAAALFAGVLLVVLEKLTMFCAALPGSALFFGGTVMAALLLLYPLGFLAYKSRRVKAFLLAGVLLLGMGVFLDTALRRGVVQISVVGSSAYSSIVITCDGQAAVIYRDRRTLAAVQRALQEQGVKDCVLLLDLRQTGQSTEYRETILPAEEVVVSRDVLSRAVYPVFENLTIYVARQPEGMLACLDVAGYKVGIYTGRVDFSLYDASLDVLLAGQREAGGAFGTPLVLGEKPDWVAAGAACFTSAGEPVISIRPAVSVRFKEVADGADFG